ncbi:MAG: 6-bladed beta-propeller [Bacillota bacterium]|nr:6-bladed beta-propeller [Bacillota bacterium]
MRCGQTAGRAAALALVLILTVSVGAGWAGVIDVPAGAAGREEKGAEGEALVWPPPPERARIAYVRSISAPEDVALRKGKPWWKVILDFILGPSREDRLVRPYGLTVADGKLYIVDAGDPAVWRVDFQQHKMERAVDGRRVGFAMPIGVAVDARGRIFVSDSGRQSLLVFTPEGKLIQEIKGPPLQRPTGLAIDREKDRLYVADALGHAVQVLDTSTLRWAATFGRRGGGQGEFNFPAHLYLRDGRLYVTDTMNFRVQILDAATGRYLGGFGRLGDGTGDFARPKGVAVDRDGHIYVVDALFETVQIFDRQGRLLLYFGRTGRQPGEFWLPTEIYLDGEDYIYVADSYNRRVQVFKYLGDNK